MEQTTMIKQLTTYALLGLLSTGLTAATTINESRTASPDARISFSAVTGEFKIIGSADNQLTVTGTLGSDVREFSIEGDADNWHIELQPIQGSNRMRRQYQASVLTISVPINAELEARTVSGQISLLDLQGPWVNARSVSGAITTDNVRPERLSIETVSGKLEVRSGGQEETRLRSVSGNMNASELRGRVNASSVSGIIAVAASQLEEADFETVSGGIQATLAPLDRARIRANSHSGAIDIELPQGTPLDLRASSFSGRIRSDFGGEVERGRGPGERLEHREGNGQVRVAAQSFSGRINLTRAQ
jgi:DUF4097 and DUF4098 domain-containing protein YvlB